MSNAPFDSLDHLCVGLDSTLWQAMEAIEMGGVEIAFVVDDERRVVGTVTDGDMRRALLSGAAFDGAIADIMSKSFHSIGGEGNHRAHAVEAMVAYGVKQVPVIDDEGRLIGLHVIEEYIQTDPLPNWAVILAGGKGTRLRPITERIPKPMVAVAGRPILERLILGLVGAGITRIFLAVNYKKEVIKHFFGTGAEHGCRIEYLEEDTALGTGGPLALLPGVPEDPVILMNGDLIGDLRVRQLLEHHAVREHAITVGVGLHAYRVPYGVVETAGDRVTRIREKPRYDWWINYGVYAISPDVLPLVTPGVEFPVTDLINTCLERGDSVGTYQIEGEWQDVGRPEDLMQARGHDLS